MKRANFPKTTVLDVRDTLPTLKLTTLDGPELTLPDDIATPYAALLFYRGHW